MISREIIESLKKLNEIRKQEREILDTLVKHSKEHDITYDEMVLILSEAGYPNIVARVLAKKLHTRSNSNSN